MRNSAALLLTLVTTFGVGSTYLGQEPDVPCEVPVIKAVTSLENARRASIGIRLPGYYSSGSATLIARTRLDDEACGITYKYTGLTAQHVISDMLTALQKKRGEADMSMELFIQPHFHGKATRISITVDTIPWSVPGRDWAFFTFIIPEKLACAPLADREKFESILPWEDVYVIGCGGAYLQFHRKAQVGATHNEHMDSKGQQTSAYPWNLYPVDYFRVNTNIWYGDSGGSVFNKDGELIGLINAFGIMNGWSPVTHSGVALKTYTVLELAGASKNYFLIED